VFKLDTSSVVTLMTRPLLLAEKMLVASQAQRQPEQQ